VGEFRPHAARRCVRRVYQPGIVQNAEEVPYAVLREPQPVPMPAQIQEQPAQPTATEVGRALLAETRRRVMAEQEHRAAMRIAELMRSLRERNASKVAKQATAKARERTLVGGIPIFTGISLRSASLAGQQSYSVEAPSQPIRAPLAPFWPRKRRKFYAVRRGRSPGIYHSWEECERQVKGVYSEFKSFHSLEEAEEYLRARRTNYMLVANAVTNSLCRVGTATPAVDCSIRM
jgi:hypothetical protein